MFAVVFSTILLTFTAAAPSSVELQPTIPVLSNAVTYAALPTVNAYTSTIIKPQLSAYPLLRSNIVAAEPTHVEVHEPTLTKVGDVVESVPTAVSHQSSTIVHSRGQRVTPIVAPTMYSYTAPAVRTYAASDVSRFQHSPFLRSLPTELGPAAAFVHAHAPYQLRTYNALAPFTYANYDYSNYGHPFVYTTSGK